MFCLPRLDDGDAGGVGVGSGLVGSGAAGCGARGGVNGFGQRAESGAAALQGGESGEGGFAAADSDVLGSTLTVGLPLPGLCVIAPLGGLHGRSGPAASVCVTSSRSGLSDLTCSPGPCNTATLFSLAALAALCACALTGLAACLLVARCSWGWRKPFLRGTLLLSVAGLYAVVVVRSAVNAAASDDAACDGLAGTGGVEAASAPGDGAGSMVVVVMVATAGVGGEEFC